MKRAAKISRRTEPAKSVPGRANVVVEMPEALSNALHLEAEKRGCSIDEIFEEAVRKETPMRDFERFHAEKHIRRTFRESMQLKHDPAYDQILCLRELLAGHRKMTRLFAALHRVVFNSGELGSFAVDCYHFSTTPAQTEYSQEEIKMMRWYYNYQEQFHNHSFLEELRIYGGLAPLFVEHPRFSKIGRAMQRLVAAAMELTGEGGAQ